MNFLKLTVSEVGIEAQEILIAQLSEYPFQGFEQKENNLLAYANEKEVNYDQIAHLLKNNKVQHEIIPEVNWNERWERDFEPIIIDQEVAIRAHFHKKIDSVLHEIIVTPKMSFGTGHHATTQLMLKQMSIMNLSNCKVFDYGTGTGVLAIYASMLGATNVIANDIDPWSEENAKENIQRNNCNNIDVRLGGIEVIKEDSFDLILANINLNVLKASMDSLLSKLKKGQKGLLISGILQENEPEIIAVIDRQNVDYQIFVLDKWLCLHVKV